MMKKPNPVPKELKSQIDQLEKIRQDFVANVSHELRTPLTVMHGYLESLVNRKGDNVKVTKKIVSQLYQHTLRMENIVNDLLLLSRLEGGQQQELEEKSVNVCELLKHICEDAKEIGSIKKHKIELIVDEHLNLLGSKEELKSVFTNLVINAVKYTPADGCIIIRWFLKDGQAIFSVEDTGIGIEPKHIPRLTERFYRVDKARSRDSGGTGLGLAIVKHVLMRHNADLTIKSELNIGSVFTCIFPRKRTLSHN